MDSEYKVVRLIGMGSEGQVYLCSKNKEKYAVKIIKKSMIKSESKFKGLLNELMKIEEGQYVCKLIEHRQDSKYYYLIMEYCDSGNMYQYLQKNSGKLSPNEVSSEMFTTSFCCYFQGGSARISTPKYIYSTYIYMLAEPFNFKNI